MSLKKESVVVITGAASGIGRALAVRLSREPIAGIALADISAGPLMETEKLLGGREVKLSTHLVNVASESEMRAFVDDVVSAHGRVTHVINNAGVALGGTVREVSLDDMRWLMGVNYWGVVYGTKLFLPHLEKEASAHIVNISSIFGVIAPPGQAAYCSSKFAVRGFTESLRHELEGTNIAVSVVHPGGIKTNIANNARIGEGVQMSEMEIAAKRRRINRNLDRTPVDQAAEVIVKGIKARRGRILIGTDARLLSLFSRLLPRRYFGLVHFLSRGRIVDT